MESGTLDGSTCKEGVVSALPIGRLKLEYGAHPLNAFRKNTAIPDFSQFPRQGRHFPRTARFFQCLNLTKVSFRKYVSLTRRSIVGVKHMGSFTLLLSLLIVRLRYCSGFRQVRSEFGKRCFSSKHFQSFINVSVTGNSCPSHSNDEFCSFGAASENNFFAGSGAQINDRQRRSAL